MPPTRIPPAPLLIIEPAAPPEARFAAPAGSADGLRHLGRLLADVAARNAQARAITSQAAAWNYGQLRTAALSIAATLLEQPAFRPGERVVLLLHNSAEYAAAFYGVLLAGGVVVPLPPKSERGALQAIVDSTEAVLIIASPPIARSWIGLDDRPASLVSFSRASSIDALPPTPVDDVDGSGLAAIFFTAGSTGSPRGVMLSHSNLIANARSISEYLRIGEGDRPLCVLPFHHAFGNSVLQSHLLAGAHVVLDGQTTFPETLIEALERHQCTSLSGVPDLFRMLLERTSLGRTVLPTLRYMAVAGGALPKALALEVARRIAPAELFVMYGQTEATARLAYVPPDRLAELPDGAIGRNVPGATLEVVDEAGAPVPAGVIGELRATGPNVMLGYWRNPDATSERIRGGWLSTGDLATVDDAGTIILKGRRNALLKIAGFRVHPTDLEDFVVRCFPTAQAVAAGYEAPGAGTRLALFVRTRDAESRLTSSEVMARCRGELPRHMVPDFVSIVDEFPLNDALKIDRQLLVRLAEGEAARLRTSA